MNPTFLSVDNRMVKAAVFAAAATQSSEVDLGGGAIVGIYIPAGFTTANLTFQSTPQSGAGQYGIPDLPFATVYDDAGTPAVITLTGAVAERYYKFGTENVQRLSHLRNVKLIASAGQTGGSTVYLVLAPAC